MLDRDGVINEDRSDYIKSPEEWVPIAGSLEAIAQLNQAGFSVVVVSNQSGIARQLFTLEILEKIHQKMRNRLLQAGGKIDRIYFCPHLPSEHCECRKPKIGLFQQIQHDFSIDFKDTFFIGDKYIDYLTARNVGCPFILVQTGYGTQELLNHPDLKSQTLCFKNLQEAASWIIHTKKK